MCCTVFKIAVNNYLNFYLNVRINAPSFYIDALPLCKVWKINLMTATLIINQAYLAYV